MWRIHLNYVENWAKEYEGPQFHAILTDLPYNLESITKRFGKEGSSPAKFGKDGAFNRVGKGFMGKTWDTDIACKKEFWELLKPVLYPGAFGLAYMGTRTYHRAATAIEEAGFIIHPMIGWVQSQGFPKATRIDTQLDRNAGIERKVVGPLKNAGSTKPRLAMGDGWQENPMETEPATAEAKIWEGYRYGLQSLKPCMEPIIMFQKPYEGKPVDCIVATGAGALNIEGTKFEVGRTYKINRFDDGMKPFGEGAGHEYSSDDESRLYPANFIIDDGVEEPYKNFFYQAKASRKERDAGLANRNEHPTIKPIELNKYLATLLLPPNTYESKLLVPFSGTGSEVIGALLAKWDCVVGIECEEESYNTSLDRIKHWVP